MPTDFHAPTDTPLISILRQFEEQGFAGQFQAVEGPELLCLTCHQTTPLSSVDANHIVRLEGASDPADMLAVIPVTCERCGTGGTIVSNYGPEATIEEAELLTALDRTPSAPETAHPHPPA